MAYFEHDYRLRAMCPDCEGKGTVWAPRTWGNDPEGQEVECLECEGSGEIDVEEEEDAAS